MVTATQMSRLWVLNVIVENMNRTNYNTSCHSRASWNPGVLPQKMLANRTLSGFRIKSGMTKYVGHDVYTISVRNIGFP